MGPASTKFLKRSDQSNRGSSMPGRPAEQFSKLLDNAIRFLDAVRYLNLQKFCSFSQISRRNFELGSLEPGKLADVHV